MLRALGGGELFGEIWGPEPVSVVAIHGWRRTHVDFSQVLGPSAGAEPIPTVAPDLPGFGATPPPDDVWGSEDYAEAVTRLIESPDGPPGDVVVVGHSLGGRVAVRLAARRPELVRALVLTGAPLMPRDGAPRRPPRAFRAVRVLRRLGLVSEQRMETARRRHGSSDYRNAEGVMRDILVRLVNETYEDSLSQIRCPVELVWGDQDTEAPLSVAERLKDRLPLASLTVCAGAGHLLPVERPLELRAAVERCLSVPERTNS